MAEPTTPPNPGADDGHGTGGEQVRTFKQSELDAMFAERATRAKTQALSELCAGLGVKDVDELKGLLGNHRKLEGDLTTAQKEIETRKGEIETAKAQATERLMRAELVTEAMKQGVAEAEIPTAWLVLRADANLLAKVKPKEDGSFEGIAEVVKDISKAHPTWLKGAPGPKLGTPPVARPPQPSPNPAQPPEPTAPVFTL